MANIEYISVAIEITANGSRMDQSCVIQKISRELTTPLWKFSHLILGLKKWFVSAVS